MDQADPKTSLYLGTQNSEIHFPFDPQVSLQGLCIKKGACTLLGLFPERHLAASVFLSLSGAQGKFSVKDVDRPCSCRLCVYTSLSESTPPHPLHHAGEPEVKREIAINSHHNHLLLVAKGPFHHFCSGMPPMTSLLPQLSLFSLSLYVLLHFTLLILLKL